MTIEDPEYREKLDGVSRREHEQTGCFFAVLTWIEPCLVALAAFGVLYFLQSYPLISLLLAVFVVWWVKPRVSDVRRNDGK